MTHSNDSTLNEIPLGFCQCGCGGKTRIAPVTKNAIGWKKGIPTRFLFNHHVRKHAIDCWVEEDRGFITPCHIWKGTLNTNGYPTWLDPQRKRVMAVYRSRYEDVRGPIPPGLHIDHLCRNPACVNPDHLEAVTPAINIQRSRKAKLTPEIVRELRRRYPQENYSQLARVFGVSQAAVSDAIRGESWKNVV